jgi:hypothetical protein
MTETILQSASTYVENLISHYQRTSSFYSGGIVVDEFDFENENPWLQFGEDLANFLQQSRILNITNQEISLSYKGAIIKISHIRCVPECPYYDFIISATADNNA